jgi:hypothetical protein
MQKKLDDLARLSAKEDRRRAAKQRQRRAARERKATAAQQVAASVEAPPKPPVPSFTFGGAPALAAGTPIPPFGGSASAAAGSAAATALPGVGLGAPAAAGATGGASGGPRITPVHVPMLGKSLNPGPAHAQVSGRVTSENLAAARQSGRPNSLVERHAVFPGRSQRRCVMVFASSRAASMSETELGTAIGRAIDAGLTEEAFRGLLRWLAEVPSIAPRS